MMEDDIFLSVAVDLFIKKIWDEETFRRQVLTHAKENGMSESDVNEFLGRVLPKKELSIEEKRNLIKNARFENGSLKYPNAVDSMPDETVEKIFAVEKNNLKQKDVKAEEVSEETAENNKTETINNEEQVAIPVIEIPNIEVSSEKVTEEPKVVKVTVEEEKKDEAKNVVIQSDGVDNVFNIFNISNEVGNEDSKEEQVSEMPETEKEFENINKNTTTPEKDSTVTRVNASPERINKLKKQKKKIINYFIKGAIVVTTLAIISPIESIPLIGGYLILANKIKAGTFNPKTKVGEAAKKIVEAIMNVGLDKDMEGEKTK